MLTNWRVVRVFVSSFSKAGAQMGFRGWLEQQGVQKHSRFVNCQQADIHVQYRAEHKAIVMHKYICAAPARSCQCKLMVVCGQYVPACLVSVVCSLWMLYIIEHLRISVWLISCSFSVKVLYQLYKVQSAFLF